MDINVHLNMDYRIANSIKNISLLHMGIRNVFYAV